MDFIILLRHFKTFKPSFAPSATEGQSPDTYTRFLSHYYLHMIWKWRGHKGHRYHSQKHLALRSLMISSLIRINLCQTDQNRSKRSSTKEFLTLSSSHKVTDSHGSRLMECENACVCCSVILTQGRRGVRSREGTITTFPLNTAL